MMKFLKKIIINFKLAFDNGGFFFGFAALLLKIYKIIGVKNLKYSTKFIKFIWIFPLRDHYYGPQFKNEHLRSKFKKSIKNLNIFDEDKLNINFSPKHKFTKELLSLKLDQKDNLTSFTIKNPFFSRGDEDLDGSKGISFVKKVYFFKMCLPNRCLSIFLKNLIKN